MCQCIMYKHIKYFVNFIDLVEKDLFDVRFKFFYFDVIFHHIDYFFIRQLNEPKYWTTA